MHHHHNRTVIIFTLFILVAVSTSVFIFFYRERTDRIVNTYVSEITICGNITDENDCAQKDFCEGIYTPSGTTLQFTRCANISPAIQSERTQEQKLCASTGGQWYKNNYGAMCLCNAAGAGKEFNPQQGCVTKSP